MISFTERLRRRNWPRLVPEVESICQLELVAGRLVRDQSSVRVFKRNKRDRNLLLVDEVSWVSKPCRCLSHITPVIPNRHFIPSSLLFFIHNSQLALISGCFQAELPPNGHRTPRLGSNNGSGDIRDGMVAKRNLAALGPLLLSGRCSGGW